MIGCLFPCFSKFTQYGACIVDLTCMGVTCPFAYNKREEVFTRLAVITGDGEESPQPRLYT